MQNPPTLSGDHGWDSWDWNLLRASCLREARRLLDCEQDAEEAAQDALLLVATKIHTFGGRSRFTTWLHAVASNSARSTYRTLKRRAAERLTDELPCTPTRAPPA